jgi:uncharacterized membrane protein
MAETLAHRHVRPLEIGRRPIGNLLLPIPIICFIGAVLTDWSYLGSDGNLTWLFFSTWLIPAGLRFGGLAALFLRSDAVRLRGRWLAFILLACAWVIELFNAFVHMRDGWTAVAGLGIILSIIGALLALASGWFVADNRSTYTGEVA